MSDVEAQLEFRPSLKAAAVELSIGATLFAITLALLFHFFVGIKPAWLSAGAGAAFGVTSFTWYFGRYLVAAKRICVTDDRIIIHGRTEETCFFNEVRRAFHESHAGLRWRLELPNASIVIRDDGFTASQWDELSKAIEAGLERYGIVSETAGWAAAFDHQDDDK
jgi:hypothetical protein